jgi:serine/threonine protein kinase
MTPVLQPFSYDTWKDKKALGAALADILKALKFVHDKGFVHMDIRPPNILQQSNPLKLFLSDWGFSGPIGTLNFPSNMRYLSQRLLSLKSHNSAVGDGFQICDDLEAFVKVAIVLSSECRYKIIQDVRADMPVVLQANWEVIFGENTWWKTLKDEVAANNFEEVTKIFMEGKF